MYAHNDKHCNSRGDPFNIIFLHADAKDLGKTLRGIRNISTGKTWHSPQLLHFATARDQWAGSGATCKKQDDQCVTGKFWYRFHIRIWQFPGMVLAGAHHENLLTLGGNVLAPHAHQPDSFDSGKNVLVQDFGTLGRRVQKRAFDMGNSIITPSCDGEPAVIS